MFFDLADSSQRRLHERLESEALSWLTTVYPSGRPASSLVWHLWDGERILVYSQEADKVRNIERHPAVCFNLNSNDRGGDVLVIDGVATVDRSLPRCDEIDAYVTKYAGRIDRLGMNPTSFADTYHVPISVEPRSYRAW